MDATVFFETRACFPLTTADLQVCQSVDHVLGEVGGKLFFVSNVSEKLTSAAAKETTTDRAQVEYALAGGVTYPTAELRDDSAKPANAAAAAGRLTASPRAMAMAAAESRRRRGGLWAAVPFVERLHRTLVRYVPATAAILSFPLDDGSAMQRRSSGVVKAVAFHPHLFVIAVAVQQAVDFGDTAIHVFDVGEQKWDETSFKHVSMRDVMTMHWKPRSEDVLLVGCAKGVFAWSTKTQLDGAAHRGACVFYEFSTNAAVAVTCMAMTRAGRYLAAGSSSATHLNFYDLSKAPHDALAMSSTFYDGPTSCAAFSADDRWCLRGSTTGSELNLVHTVSWAKTTTLLAAPCEDIVPCWDRRASESIAIVGGIAATGASSSPSSSSASEPLRNHFLLQLRRLEGVVLSRLDSATGELSLLRAIVTGSSHERGSLSALAGGAVTRCVVSNRRVFLHLQRGHVVVLHLSELSPTTCGENGISLRPIAVFGCHTDITLEPFHGFTKGSLVAAVRPNATINFLPFYHATATQHQ